MIYSKVKKWLEQRTLILSFSLALILFVLTFIQFNSALTIKGGSEVAFFGKMLGAGQLFLRKKMNSLLNENLFLLTHLMLGN